MNHESIKMKKKKGVSYPYLFLNIGLLLLAPAISFLIEKGKAGTGSHCQLIGKWFIFWAVGIRLFTAGLKQASNPEFTASSIFNIKEKASYVIIRELGFANMALGTMGILSVLNDHWRLIAAIVSCIFFGLAALQHAGKKPESANEMIALFYDTVVVIVLTWYLLL